MPCQKGGERGRDRVCGQYLAVFHETTEERDIRERLGDTLTQAQNSNRARTAFFSSMSHEIRTPMNGIMGMTNITLKNLDDREKIESCLNKISAASDHLQKVLLNLLSNAVKYTQEGGEISLQITETPMEADTIRMSQITGTGLGLAITKSIVDIRIESEENRGSRFTVEIYDSGEVALWQKGTHDMDLIKVALSVQTAIERILS